MDAGKELDSLIHEKVFRLCAHHIHVYEKDNRDWTDDYVNYRCKKCKERFRGLRYRKGMVDCPNYSTDIAYAHKALEEFETYRLTKRYDGTYLCEIEHSKFNRIDKVKWVEKTVPLAICNAIIKLIGE